MCVILLRHHIGSLVKLSFYKYLIDCVSKHIRYGDYGVLGTILEKYLKTTDNILQVGCGNSQLAAQVCLSIQLSQSVHTDVINVAAV